MWCPGIRSGISSADLSSVVPEEVEEEVRSAAEVSMGTEISDEDWLNICHLCDQVIEISDYRAELYQYIKNRMMAIAPNLTTMVGELVGARLIAHAGKRASYSSTLTVTPCNQLSVDISYRLSTEPSQASLLYSPDTGS